MLRSQLLIRIVQLTLQPLVIAGPCLLFIDIASALRMMLLNRSLFFFDEINFIFPFCAYSCESKYKKPFWAAGFSFSRGHFKVQVPYDGYQPMVFQVMVG